MTKMIRIERKDFRRAITLAYQRGCIRDPNHYITEEELQGVISDIYALLSIPSEPADAEDSTSEICEDCFKMALEVAHDEG